MMSMRAAGLIRQAFEGEQVKTAKHRIEEVMAVAQNLVLQQLPCYTLDQSLPLMSFAIGYLSFRIRI